LDGEIIQCLPLNEMSYATNDRNKDTLSIEVCHPDETGQFNQATYDSLVKLTAWLCDSCGINRENVIRHYDVTGKPCPLYFVDHPDAWEQFLKDVKKY
ncbi:MAG: N-acetylmuramoyl-L-alanine amidase, partial [Ruminiclostridium sp.]|nr:N-acetylmuramoyl-L-alanine amidase [Ruminiclostridium sp.]